MKFSDGEWLMQPGVSAFYPAEAHDVTEENGTLLIHAPTRPINHRGDTLGGPLLTIRLSSPMADVIRVRIEHFSGTAGRNPQIPLQPQPAPKIPDSGPGYAAISGRPNKWPGVWWTSWLRFRIGK